MGAWRSSHSLVFLIRGLIFADTRFKESFSLPRPGRDGIVMPIFQSVFSVLALADEQFSNGITVNTLAGQ